MGFWDQQGRPAIMAAVEAACDAVAESLTAEMRHRDQTQHAFLTDEVKRLEASAARAIELAEENKAITRELNELREKLKQQPSVPVDSSPDAPGAHLTAKPALPTRQGVRQPLRELPLNVVSVPAQPTKPLGPDTPTLANKYAELLKSYEELEKKFEIKRAVGRNLKDQRNVWMKYAESLETKVKKLKQKLDTLENPDKPVAIAQEQTPGGDTENALPSFASSFRSNPEQDSGPGEHRGGVEVLRHSKRAVSIPATLISPQNIPAETTGVPPLAEEETWSGNEPEQSDDLPQLPPQPALGNQDKIKQEPSSDGPVVVSERNLHKRKNNDEAFRLPPARRVKAEHNASSDPVITGELPVFCPHSSIDLDSGQGEVTTPRRLRHIEIETPVSPVSNSPSRRQREPLKEIDIGDRHGIYTPLSANTKPDRPSGTMRSRRTDTAHDWTLANGVVDLAEDIPVALPHPTAKTGRLQGLLNNGSSEGDAAILLRTPLAREIPRPAAFVTDIPKGRSAAEKHLPTPVRTPAVSTAAQSVPRRRIETTVDTRAPQQTSLRERPMSELRPEDFKINPTANNGHKHAFNEVVRNRAERAELGGCTDPNCCGRAFTVMAKSEIDTGGLEILRKPENKKLLEDHLGDQAYKLGSMTLEEKKESWMEAKIKDLANKYGRHRHRHDRPPSPPGYWNPDFPSTQEIEERRKESEKIERKMVEERRREAMKAGGRWLFRDE